MTQYDQQKLIDQSSKTFQFEELSYQSESNNQKYHIVKSQKNHDQKKQSSKQLDQQMDQHPYLSQKIQISDVQINNPQHKQNLKKYYDYFENVIPSSQNYIPKIPSDEDLKKHKIKLLSGNLYYQKLRSYKEPDIRIKSTQRQGTIVIYTVIISIFELQIILLNIHKDANIQQYKIGRGSFGSVRIQSQNNRIFAVKRQMFRDKFHMKQFNMTANKYEINQVIKQLAIYKICSLLKIGPTAETDIGFDLICYRDCIEFQIQYCMKIEYDIRYDGNKHGIYVDKSKFEKQIKQCLLTLHSYRIIHKDIKPANILFSIKYNKYVLADFGISHPVIQDIGYPSKTFLQGTPQYMSEQMKNAFLKGEKTAYVNLYRNDIHSLSTVLKKQMTNQNIQQELKQLNQKWNRQHQNKKFEYEYLKLKYYCIKPNTKMEEVQFYWRSMDFDRLNQLIQIVDKSIEYDKIKSVYNYLAKQQKFKNFNLDSLRIQSQSIKSLKIEPNIKQNTQLQLMNKLRVYGYSLQVKKIIIKLKLQQKYKETLKIIHRVLEKDNQINHIDLMLGKNGNYIKKLKKQLQKLQQQQNYEKIFKIYMIILSFGNEIEKMEIIEKLKKMKYDRKIDQKIEQIIKVSNFGRKKENLYKFRQQINIQDQKIEKILKEKELYQQIAQLYSLMGKYETSLKYYNKNLNMVIQFHGQEHPNIARRYHDIAIVYYKMGKYETALKYYNKSLNIYISFHGQQHPTIAIVYNGIASIIQKMGKYETALTYFTKSLRILRSYQLCDHQYFIDVYNNIGLVYEDMGKHEKAMTYFIKSLNLCTQFHRQNSTVAVIYNNIAHSYSNRVKYKIALAYYLKSLNMYISLHGQQHSNTARTYNNIAGVYYYMGKYETALTYYTKSLNIDILFYEQQHPDIAEIYTGIATVYHKMGKYETALTYYTKSINIGIQCYGEQNPHISAILNNIGHIYNQMGQYEISLKYYTKCLNMDILFHGEKHPNIAITYNNIALAYNSMSQYDIALEYYTKSLNMEILFHGLQHPNVARTYNNIGLTYFKMNRNEMALTYYNKSLNIDISLYRQQHSDIARTYNNIAGVYESISQYEIAVTYYLKAIKIYISQFGQQNPYVAITYNNIAYSQSKLNHYLQSHKYNFNSFQNPKQFIYDEFSSSSQQLQNFIKYIVQKKQKNQIPLLCILSFGYFSQIQFS